MKVAPRVAISFAAKLNAAGRLLLAQLPDAALTELLASNTAQDAAIKGQLSELRSTGQIVDRGAIEADVVSVCKVIRGNGNEVVGAIEVLAPQYRAKIDAIAPKLDEAASMLSMALGASKASLSVEREVVQTATNVAAPGAAITATQQAQQTVRLMK